MERVPDVYWLLRLPADWRERLNSLPKLTPAIRAWGQAAALAGVRINFSLSNASASTAARVLGDTPPTASIHGHERLAIPLSSKPRWHRN